MMGTKVNNRGEGRLGCLIFLLLFATFVLVAIKTGPVYLDKVNFDDGLARLVSRAGVDNWPTESVIQRTLVLAESHSFECKREDILVTRPGRFQTVAEIRIRVTFRRVVVFTGYTHTFHFETRASSFVGRL